MSVTERAIPQEIGSEVAKKCFIELGYVKNPGMHESFVALNAIASHVKRVTLRKGIPGKVDSDSIRELHERTKPIRDSAVHDLARRIREGNKRNGPDGMPKKNFLVQASQPQLAFLCESLMMYEAETIERAGTTMNNISGDNEAAARICEGQMAGDMHARYAEKLESDTPALPTRTPLGFH